MRRRPAGILSLARFARMPARRRRTRELRKLRASLAAALAAALAAHPAGAAPEAAPDAADPGALAAEVREIRAALIAAAAAVQAREADIAAAGAALEELDARYGDNAAALDAARGRLEGLLAGLALFARDPPNGLTGGPADWADVVRGLLVVERLVPAVRARAAIAANAAEESRRLRAEGAARRGELGAARAVLAEEQARLGELLERKSRLQAEAAAERSAETAAAAELAARAGDAGELADSIATARAEAARPPPAARPAAAAAPRPEGSSLPWPAHGAVSARFGDESRGERSRGISIDTAAGAQVVAPDDGDIVFAGPFRSYGQLLIIAHGGGYHSLMAGLARIDGLVGQRVLAGEPVGVMGAEPGRAPALYVEVRRGGGPVDPIPWLLSGDRKGDG